MNTRSVATVFCILSFLAVVENIQGEEGAHDFSAKDVRSVIAALREYYGYVSTVQLECSEKRVAFTSNESETIADDLIELKLNLDRRELLKKIIDSKTSLSGRPKETLQSVSQHLELLYDAESDKIVIIGESLAHSKDAEISPAFAGNWQVLPFGFFSTGRKTFHVLDWLENNSTKVSRVTEKECVLESNGSDGNLEIVMTNYNGSFYITSLSYSIPTGSGNEILSLYSEIEYRVTDYKFIENFWLPIHFEIKTVTPGEGRYTFDPSEGKMVPLPANPYSIRSQIIFTDVKLNPFPKNKELIFDTPIADGTQVQLLSQMQIEYVWLDGKIVAKTDEVALRIARGDHGFMPGPKNPRLWFMILGAVLLLVGGGLKIRTMLRPV